MHKLGLLGVIITVRFSEYLTKLQIQTTIDSMLNSFDSILLGRAPLFA